MRYHYLPYFLLLWLCCWTAWAGAQTPYDSFAPEMSRPILDKDSVDAWRKEQQMCYMLDTAMQVLAYSPIPEKVCLLIVQTLKNHVVVGDFVNTAQILANPLLTKWFSTYLMILPGKTQLILPKSGNTHSMQNFIKWK